MVDVPPWVAALKIKEETFREWLELFPSPDFILSWAIESKHVNETEYLVWASRHYKLPLLKADFFNQPPPIETWKKHLSGPWGPTVMPLYENKETLFVGVLEPKNFALDGVKVQLVLAPSTSQNSWWHKFIELKRNQNNKVEVVENLGPITPLGLEKPTFASVDAPEGLEDPHVAPQNVVPDGLEVANIPDVPLGNLENLLPSDVPSSPGNGPEGLTLTPPAPAAQPQPTKFSIVPPPPPPEFAPITPPTPPNEVSPKEPKDVPPPVPTDFVDHDKNSGTPSGSIKLVFEQFRRFFDRSMLLLKDNDSLRPHQWDEGWHRERLGKPEVNLSGHSIFKIAVDTRHPYHGYVKPSEMNSHFFRKWNSNRYPEHATVLPLKRDGAVFAVLISVSTAAKANSIQLNQCEAIVDQLALELKNIKPKAA